MKSHRAAKIAIPLVLLTWSVATLGAFGVVHAAPAGRHVEAFNQGWRFALGPQDDGASPALDDASWRPVELPHDWAIAGPFDPAAPGATGKLPWKGEGWYRKRFDLPAEDAGRRVYLLFDGVMAEPTVWINGKKAGGWDYGYNSFWVDATPHVNFGQSNLIAVHADTRRHASRWYPGAGIYRRVTLHVASPVHVDHWGLHVETKQADGGRASALVRCRVVNKGAQPDEAAITLSLLGPDGELIAATPAEGQTIPARGSIVVEHRFKVKDARLWSVDEPTLYTARADIAKEDQALDERETRFGFRTIEFTPNYGFYLNGRRLQLKGVNLHHDLGPLGAAFSKPAARRRLAMMKRMGANAIRTSHNPAAPELLDLCDEMGLLVFNELFDKWDATADLHDPSGFEPFVARQVENFVRRDRNHPSVIVWGIGDEVGLGGRVGEQQVAHVVDEFKKHDKTRPVTLAFSSGRAFEGGLLDPLDVVSTNHGRKHALVKRRRPKAPTIFSASAGVVSTRGHYELPLARSKTEFNRESGQVGSHDLNAPAWADIPDVEFESMQRDRYCSGEFVLAGYDYLGDPTPFNDEWSEQSAGDFTRASRSSYFGVVDLCGLPKDRYYLYRSHWAPKKTTIHIVPHWNWAAGQKVPVHVYTNGDEAELFLNGGSLGRRKKNPKAASTRDDYSGVVDRYRLRWKEVVHEPGELKVVAYRKGKEVGTATIRTAGQATRLRLTADQKKLRADGADLSFVQVDVVDAAGVLCPNRDDRVKFQVSGPATIAGVGNGNPRSLESFVDDEHPVFYGKAVLILRSRRGAEGEVTLTARAAGLEPATVKLRTLLPPAAATE